MPGASRTRMRGAASHWSAMEKVMRNLIDMEVQVVCGGAEFPFPDRRDVERQIEQMLQQIEERERLENARRNGGRG